VNIVRLGHYFHPYTPKINDADQELTGSCQTALVVGVQPTSPSTKPETVNLVVWDKDGDSFRRLDVPVADALVALHPIDKGDTFHLSGDCPWKR
jgi:hypothetical protein